MIFFLFLWKEIYTKIIFFSHSFLLIPTCCCTTELLAKSYNVFLEASGDSHVLSPQRCYVVSLLFPLLQLWAAFYQQALHLPSIPIAYPGTQQPSGNTLWDHYPYPWSNGTAKVPCLGQILCWILPSSHPFYSKAQAELPKTRVGIQVSLAYAAFSGFSKTHTIKPKPLSHNYQNVAQNSFWQGLFLRTHPLLSGNILGPPRGQPDSWHCKCPTVCQALGGSEVSTHPHSRGWCYVSASSTSPIKRSCLTNIHFFRIWLKHLFPVKLSCTLPTPSSPYPIYLMFS